MYIENFDPYDFSKKEIDGVPVYYKNLPWAPCIHLRIVFNSGAFNDPVGKEGLAHFLEHLPSNGSPLIPDKKAMREWVKINTLNTRNAWTHQMNTAYWCECLPEKYEEVLRGMKDTIFFPHLRPEDVEHERKVVTQEAWGRLQNEKYLAYIQDSMQNLFAGHTHARAYSAAGWPNTIAAITRDDLVAWHKKHYGIGNFFIVLSGAVEEKHIDQIHDFVKGLPHAGDIEREYGSVQAPKEKRWIKNAEDIGEVKEQVELSFVRVAEPIPYKTFGEVKNIFHKLTYDLLHERLRIEHSLCYGVSMNIENTKTYSQFYAGVKTDEKNLGKAEEESLKIFADMKSGKFADRFATIKKVYIDQIRSREMSSAKIADVSVEAISRYDEIITQKEQLEAVESVTYEQVTEFAQWLIDPEYIHTEIILPSKK